MEEWQEVKKTLVFIHIHSNFYLTVVMVRGKYALCVMEDCFPSCYCIGAGSLMLAILVH